MVQRGGAVYAVAVVVASHDVENERPVAIRKRTLADVAAEIMRDPSVSRLLVSGWQRCNAEFG
jgi:hypothetical protein